MTGTSVQKKYKLQPTQELDGSEKMAPRRNNLAEVVGLENEPEALTRCCVPGDCLRGNALIALEDLRDTVRVTCNNESCGAGRFMHRECFDVWEQSILAYLKSCGRARSWSERQRAQNLWTKKGYDLAYKACGCRCGRGHLKKDLDWSPPPPGFGSRAGDLEDMGKKKKKKKSGRPPLTAQNGNHTIQTVDRRMRTGSLSSSTGSSSPPASASSVSPVHSGSAVKRAVKGKIEFFSDR